jgi:hypothetical protein
MGHGPRDARQSTLVPIEARKHAHLALKISAKKWANMVSKCAKFAVNVDCRVDIEVHETG